MNPIQLTKIFAGLPKAERTHRAFTNQIAGTFCKLFGIKTRPLGNDASPKMHASRKSERLAPILFQKKICICALKNALRDTAEIRSALIVLPERRNRVSLRGFGQDHALRIASRAPLGNAFKGLPRGGWPADD